MGARILAASGHDLPTATNFEWRHLNTRTEIRVTFVNGTVDLTGDSHVVERDGWFGFVISKPAEMAA